MRFFAFTFIVYLLLLSWQPCQDLAGNDLSFSTLNEAKQISHVETHENESDDCSPFCICSCCQIFTVANFPAFAVKNSYAVSTAHAAKSFYRNDYSQQHLNSIWQPPKFNS